MDIDTIIRQIFGLNPADVVQIIAIIFMVLYVVFALVILRQIQLMIRTLPSPISPVIILLGYLHLGTAIAVLILLIGVF